MSVLPNGWARVDFDESVDIVSDRGFRIKQKDYLPYGKIPVVDQGEGLIGGYTDDLDAQVTSPAPVIVFGDHTRRFKFVKFSFAVGADGVKLFSPTPVWNPNFLFMQLGTVDLENRGYGRHYQHLRKESLVLAPAAEQTRIVEKLEELLTDLDAGVAELKAAQKKLGQYRQSLLKAAVEGALTADWRESQKSQKTKPAESGAQLLKRILHERRTRWEAKQLAKFKEQGKTPAKGWQSKYVEPVAPETAGLPELPEGWVWASLDMLSEIQGGIQKQPSRIPTINKYPFLRVANVARGLLKLDDVHEIELFAGELERLTLLKGDVLIVEGNGSLSEIGRCALWDGSIENAVHQNHLIRARPIVMLSEFVESWLNSLRAIEKLTKLAATTSGLYTLSVGKISKIPVPVPPMDEQVAVMALLESALEGQRDQDVAIKNSLKQATAQRKNILKAAFSGQLVPQDPLDEPASALLARIRAERVKQEGLPKVRKTKIRREANA